VVASRRHNPNSDRQHNRPTAPCPYLAPKTERALLYHTGLLTGRIRHSYRRMSWPDATILRMSLHDTGVRGSGGSRVGSVPVRTCNARRHWPLPDCYQKTTRLLHRYQNRPPSLTARTHSDVRSHALTCNCVECVSSCPEPLLTTPGDRPGDSSGPSGIFGTLGGQFGVLGIFRGR
jgi:hypothetical protein